MDTNTLMAGAIGFLAPVAVFALALLREYTRPRRPIPKERPFFIEVVRNK